MNDNITDVFIQKILSVLPEEGLEKLNAMIDDGSISEESVNNLLKSYSIDPKIIAKEIEEEKQ